MVIHNAILTGSISMQAPPVISGSLTLTGSITSTGPITGSGFFTAGTITAQTLVVQTITSSVDFVTGSTRFGSILGNTHVFSGSVTMNPGGLFVSSSGNVGINYVAQSNIRTFIYDNSANYGLVVQQDGSGTIAQFSGNSGAVRMYISSSGNVGIGTSTPTRQLFVNSTAFFDNIGSGSTSNPSIAIGSTSLGISYLGGSNMALLTNGSTKMFISASGAVGIGATSPVGNLNLVGGTSQYIVLTNTAADGVTNAIQGGIIGQARGYGNNLAQMASILFRNKTTAPWYKGEITFNTNDTDGTDPSVSIVERMRITSGGNVGIGVSPSYRFDVQSDGCGAYVAQIQNLNSGDCGGSGCLILQGGTFNSGDTTSKYISFRRGDGTEIGAVRRNGASNVAFDTSSDYRLKEDLKNFNGLDKVLKLKVYDFQWKDTTERMDGVLAHELQEVIPYAVGGEKDGIDGKGDMIIQGVDYSKIVPILIKSIQELKAEFDEYKTTHP
jgi:hypothetical protein